MGSDSELEKVGGERRHGASPSDSIQLLHYKMDEMKRDFHKMDKTLEAIQDETQKNLVWRENIENRTNNNKNRIDEDYRQLHAHACAIDERTSDKELDKKYGHESLDKRYIKIADIKLVLLGVGVAAGASGALVSKIIAAFGH